MVDKSGNSSVLTVFNSKKLLSGAMYHSWNLKPQPWLPIYRRMKILTHILVMKVFLPRDMTNIQQGYYEHIGYRKTGNKWVITLCDKLITAKHSIWNKKIW